MRLITEITESRTVTMQELQQHLNEIPPEKAALLWRTGYADLSRPDSKTATHPDSKIIKWKLIMDEKGAK